MTTEKPTGKPILTVLRELEIGESVTYPVERTSYLRSVSVSRGLEWGRKYKTSTNREKQTITVTRVE